MHKSFLFALTALCGCAFALASATSYAATPDVKLAGPHAATITLQGKSATFDVPGATWKVVVDEKYPAPPVFNPNANSWMKGRVLRGVNACECAVFGALEPASVVVKLEATGETLTRGKDYEFDDSSGAFGRLANGKLDENAVALVSYRCVESRIDSIILNADGEFAFVQGEPLVLSPTPPTLKEGEKRLANVFTSGRDDALTEAALFPVDDAFENDRGMNAEAFVAHVGDYCRENNAPQAPDVSNVGAAKKFLPKTWKKLVDGEEVRILAWGDSVTACGYLPDDQRWQIKFANRLQEMFPKAKVTLMTEAWGGRSSDSYRNEPPGSDKNYQEKVLDLKPDLIISEFVNDAYMNEETVAKRYGEMKADFDAIGAEWIILGPHYVRPDWMGLTAQRDIDDDPRPLVKGLRAFTQERGIPFADTPQLYGKLWRAGIPYLTLMTNNINHPNDFGMELFSAALTRLFQE